jgi:hypothetical protein
MKKTTGYITFEVDYPAWTTAGGRIFSAPNNYLLTK